MKCPTLSFPIPFLIGSLLVSVVACSDRVQEMTEVASMGSRQPLAGEVVAVAYSGFREGQHPDRGEGAINPSREEILEDLEILVDKEFRLIRLYDAGENSEQVLQLIRQHRLPIKVLLGVWLDAEVSNHEGCPWLDEPIPEARLLSNRGENRAEVSRGISLARKYADIVVSVNVGNEALVAWNDHMVPVERVIDYVQQVKAAVKQPVTVADNYDWWVKDGAALGAVVDYIGVHTYPVWEGRSIEEGSSYTLADIEAVKAAFPGKPLAILEAGWATTAIEFGDRAGEAQQMRYFNELRQWAEINDTTVFFFEAFDEPWKGDPDSPLGAEKHWGLFRVDRTPKLVMQQGPALLHDVQAVTWAVNVGGEAHRDVAGLSYAGDLPDLGGEVGSIDGPVTGTQDERVFLTYRKGPLVLDRPMARGSYDITFLFAEPENLKVGERVFDILVQGETRVQGFDVRLARDGRNRAALSWTVVDVPVTDGRLEMALVPLLGEPVLSGIVVRRRQPDLREWRLVWADEFNYRGMPKEGNWTIEEWAPGRVNNEDQAYTARRRNVRVLDGRLVLEAHREAYGGGRYTSGRIHSSGKGDWLYGRIDVRARLPAGQGTWPAIWMMPTDAFRYATSCSEQGGQHGKDGCDAWPNSGEIDIMEHVGYDMNRVHGTVHNKDNYWANWRQRKGSVEAGNVDTGFHVYSLEWTPDRIEVFYDGSLYFTYINEGKGWTSWPYDHPYHLILNVAIGGDWGRAGGPIDEGIFPVRLEVDYVRVFAPVLSDVREAPAASPL